MLPKKSKASAERFQEDPPDEIGGNSKVFRGQTDEGDDELMLDDVEQLLKLLGE